jgi:hypothetical protein
MKRTIISLGVGLLLCSCGMFTPREVEQPSVETAGDPFHLYSILEKTGEQFSKIAYEDILDSNFTFVAWDNALYNRENEIEQLKTLKATCNCEVNWDTCAGRGETREGDTLTLCRTFFVRNGNSNGLVVDSGKAEISLNRSSGNIWTIVVWKEGSLRSIFHP